ncbi:MAG: B12-binding domain-containing radical SAM protein, partial [Promethearchaeota archaeon]
MFDENFIIKDWRTIDFTFGLVYPNVYKIGSSSYSIRLLYHLINSYENIACERIFLPDVKLKFPASKDYSSQNLLRSVENKILPGEFDILGFSLHFENDFKNILWLLEKAEIPLTYRDRTTRTIEEHQRYPLIIGGGPVVTSNPIPFNQIFDIFFIGDAEPNLDLFFNVFQKFNDSKISYEGLLDESKKIEGLFIPSFKNNIKRSYLKNLDESPIPIYQLSSKLSEDGDIFESNFFIEINRGCPFRCKFCISSFHNSPFRNRSYENITNVIDNAIKYSNFDTISLIGSCISSHPQFKQICEYIVDKQKRLTIPSIRVEHISPEILQTLESGNIRTITIAPEAGSEKLRYSLGKMISNEKIISVASQIRDSSIKNIKFYFLIGLPNEKEKDIYEIINLLKEINNLGFEKNSLRVNVNPFIPKLNTPYEKEVNFYFKEELNNLISKYQTLERELKNLSSIKLKFKNFKSIVKNARLQTMISL